MTTATIKSASVERIELSLTSTFTISRGSTDTVENLVVTISDTEGRSGIGGAAPSSYYDESADSAADVLPELIDAIEGQRPVRLQSIEADLEARAPDQAAARAAVSIAVHDLVSKQAGEPLYERLGGTPEWAPETSYTISIDSPAAMASQAQRIRQAGHSILKVKLGTDDDRRRIDAICKRVPDARIRVDANGEWTAAEAIEKADWLANAGVELLEQPVPADDIDGLDAVASETVIPIAADESCVTAADVPAVADAVDTVVVKLMKCGGIRPAIRQIETATAHGLDVMIGCMIESNASIAAGWHLAPLVKYADLDGSLLCANDPYDGVSMSTGKIDLTSVEAGTGARQAGAVCDE